MKRFLFILLLACPFFIIGASNRYDVRYCYVKNGTYTSWQSMSGTAVGWTNKENKICINLYWPTQNQACFGMVMTNMDIYSMSKKERKQRRNQNKPFTGTGKVTYCTYSGRFNFEKFPGGDAFPFMESPKGQWTTSSARFEYYQYNDHEVIQVFFEGYQFSISLTDHVGTFY